MNFDGVQNIRINEGNVKRIVRKSDNVVLWEKKIEPITYTWKYVYSETGSDKLKNWMKAYGYNEEPSSVVQYTSQLPKPSYRYQKPNWIMVYYYSKGQCAGYTCIQS